MNKQKIYSVIIFSLLLCLVSFSTVHALATVSGNPADWLGKIATAAEKIGASVIIIGWVIAGILWLTAMGNPAKLGTARIAILACVVGTLLVMIAATADQFVAGLFK